MANFLMVYSMEPSIQKNQLLELTVGMGDTCIIVNIANIKQM